MKRFALLFFLGWLAFHATRGGRHHHPAPPPPRPVASDLRVMVVQDDEGRPVTIVEHANDPDSWPTPHKPHDRPAGRGRVSVASNSSVAESTVTTSDDSEDVDRDFFDSPEVPEPPAPPERPIRGLERLEAKLGQIDRKVREALARSGIEKLGKIEVKLGGDEDKDDDKLARVVDGPTDRADVDKAAKADLPEVLVGRISADEDRARKDAKELLERHVAEWLAPNVPRTWSRLAREADRLIVETKVAPVEKEYGTMYKATIKADLSRAKRTKIVHLYEREQVGGRLLKMGGALAFVLVCLASTVGYIRADEATKGYYTKRLRVVTAVALGAAGFAIYRNLA